MGSNHLKTRLTFFYYNPYDCIDNLNLRFLGIQFNIMKNDQKLLKTMIFPFLIAPFTLWLGTAILMVIFTPYSGFDASLSQLSYPLTELIMGRGLDQAIFDFFDQYGKGCHWSAAIIYYLFFVALSKHFRKLGIVNSLNVGFTTCFTALTIAAFEYFWNFSFYIFQNQPWILSFTPPQTLISLQNLVFASLGLLRIGNINWKIVKPNLNKWTLIFLFATAFLIVFWWIYGLILPVQQISVEIQTGTWTSSKYFPQTVYTINRTPLDAIYDSQQYWVPNDFLHLVNTLTKIFLTLTFLNIFKLKARQ